MNQAAGWPALLLSCAQLAFLKNAASRDATAAALHPALRKPSCMNGFITALQKLTNAYSKTIVACR
jgi:hypothetical protein